MIHYSFEQWKKYANDELDEKSREVYEKHLYSCDQCLEIYFQTVEELETELPVLVNGDSFTNQLMEKIEDSKKSNDSTKRRVLPFYQKAIFHYTIAAAMTILLMSTGVFHSITNYVDAVQSPPVEEKRLSVTEGIVDKTFAWMDSFEKKNREENE